MSTTNCSTDNFVADASFYYFYANHVIAFFGVVGTCCSLSCLCKCDKTSQAAKLQLTTFFSFQLLVCALSLPGFSYVKRVALLCRADELSMEIKLFFLFCHTVFLPMERMNFAVMAVMRLLAVRWNGGYKKLVRVPVILSLEVFLLIIILSPWVMSFAINLYKKFPIEDQMTVTFSSNKSTIVKVIYLFHAANHLLPTFVSLAAYSLMMHTMWRHKLKFGTANKSSTMEQVAFTIRSLIFVNLLLDLPHTLAHIIKVSQVPSLIIHCIFYCHLAFDPLIFVALNAHYRSFLAKNVKNCFSKITRCCRRRNKKKKQMPYRRAIVVSPQKHFEMTRREKETP